MYKFVNFAQAYCLVVTFCFVVCENNGSTTTFDKKLANVTSEFIKNKNETLEVKTVQLPSTNKALMVTDDVQKNATNVEKHERVVTNTSVFPDQIQSAVSPVPSQKASSKLNNSDSSNNLTVAVKSAMSTSITKASTTPPTTAKSGITPAPKKPIVTSSVEDHPEWIAEYEKRANRLTANIHNKIDEVPIQSADTISFSNKKSANNFIFPLIGLILFIPIAVIFANFALRQVRDLWSKRNYRRMDYLIEEIYN